MNPIFSERSGVLIMKDCCRSRRPLIQMMYFGFIFVLEVRGGRRLKIHYVEFDKTRGRDVRRFRYNLFSMLGTNRLSQPK